MNMKIVWVVKVVLLEETHRLVIIEDLLLRWLVEQKEAKMMFLAETFQFHHQHNYISVYVSYKFRTWFCISILN